MDLEEANSILQFSDEEVASIQRYLGFQHTNINILADFSPKTYLTLKDTAWAIDEKPEEIVQNIQDFVNLYATMYKESKHSNIRSMLVRGTSNGRMSSMYDRTSQFLSTSTDESIAKTFTQYGDDALVHIRVGEGVPFLDPTPYRSENVRDEHEIILAPFCKTRVEKGGTFDGYTHYQVTIQKGELGQKEPEKLATLYDEIMSGFSQNIKDIKELDRLEAKLESLDRFYKQAQGDQEEQKYIREEKRKTQEEYDRLVRSTYGFKHKLQDLLQGLCKQKEMEIDQAHEVINEDRERRKAEREAREAEELARKEVAEKEEAKQKLVSELSTKLTQTPQNASGLEEALLKTYDDFVHTDAKARELTEALGIEWTKTIKNTTAKQLIEQIQANLQETVSRIDGVTVDANTTLEDAQKTASEVLAKLEGVSYGLEIAKSFPELVSLNKRQIEDEIKKLTYDRVQAVLQEARIQKYTAEKEMIQGESVGFLGRLFGKEQLKEKRLENMDLKIKLAQRSTAPEKDTYSIRQMLVDMHICANTELGGKFTPEMQEIYQAIMNTYGAKNKDRLSERNIRQLVSERQRKTSNQTTAELPVVQGNRPRIFGKTKAQTNMVELENQGLKQKLLRLRTSNSLRTGRVQQSPEADAISLLEQRLKGIAVNTQDKDRQVDLETTFDLWK